MILHADIERPVRQFHCLHQLSVRRNARQRQSRRGKTLPVIIIEFIAVTMPFADLRSSVASLHRRTGPDHTRIGAQSERASLIDLIALPGHEIDHLVRAVLIEFAGIRIRQSRDIPGILNDCDLHTET